MCHIVGVTPRKHLRWKRPLQGHEPQGVIEITDDDIAGSLDIVCAKGSGLVDYVSLGCPHMTIEEIRDAGPVSQRQKDQRRHDPATVDCPSPSKPWQISPDSPKSSRMPARVSSPAAVRSKLPAHACPPEKGEYRTGIVVNGRVGLVFDSSKQAHYLLSSVKAPIYYGDMVACLDAAISGRWEGKITWKNLFSPAAP